MAVQIFQPHLRHQLRFMQQQPLFDSLLFNLHYIFNPAAGVTAFAIINVGTITSVSILNPRFRSSYARLF